MLADDGDPVDALVVHDSATFPAVVLPCNVLGVVEVSQRGEDDARQRNDRIIAMSTWHDRLGKIRAGDPAAGAPAQGNRALLPGCDVLHRQGLQDHRLVGAGERPCDNQGRRRTLPATFTMVDAGGGNKAALARLNRSSTIKETKHGKQAPAWEGFQGDA
jgi:hypothetical protein